MKILHRLLLLPVLFFIAIGDGVFFAFDFLEHLLSFCIFALVSIARHLAAFLIQGLPKPVRRHARKVPLIIPITTKIRYFSIGVVFATCCFGIPLFFIVLFSLLPNPHSLKLSDVPQTTKIYDRHHNLLYATYATEDRSVVPLKDIPLFLREATIAIEDKNFYKNPGFDIIAILRALVSDLTHGSFQGGSTITQQLVKSTLLTPKQSLSRKLEEVFLSFWAEHIYDKDTILDLYLNEVPYGGSSYGVEAAANAYFGKDVKDLDLAQSAFLAGLPQAPTDYSPFGQNPTLWKRRQSDVLSHMQELGFISRQQEEDAVQENLQFLPPQAALQAPHFAMYIKDLLVQKYGLPLVEKGGLSVVTTLDLSIQNMAQQIVTQEVGKDGYLQITNGAAVITNPTNGDILAMVGSSDYHNPDFGNVNIATSLRQPGSSIKVVTYSVALGGKGYTAATPIDDSPISFPDGINTYTPVNYDGKFHGTVTLRQALANSFNIPAVKTLNSIGIDAFVQTGRAMGIASLQDASHYGLSVTLGSADVTMLDMATAYGTLANKGTRVDLNPILSVTDANGIVLEKKQITKEQVLDPGVTFIMSNILADNSTRSWEFGSNSPLLIPGHYVSVKTGTTNDIRDNWTDGYTPSFVVITWVGNNDNTPMNQGLVSGITGAAPIWHEIMTNLLQHTNDSQPSMPDDVLQKDCMGKPEYFLKGTENSVNCNYVVPTWTPTPTKQ